MLGFEKIMLFRINVLIYHFKDFGLGQIEVVKSLFSKPNSKKAGTLGTLNQISYLQVSFFVIYFKKILHTGDIESLDRCGL